MGAIWSRWRGREVREESRDKAQRGLHNWALAVMDQAIANAPVRTGNLRRSGRVEPKEGAHEEGGQFYVLVIFGGTNIDQLEGDVGYALYVELGTRKMHARPYLIPAMQQLRPQAKAIMEAA